MKVSDVFSILVQIAPLSYAMDYDNIGILIGSQEQTVTKICLALDITSAVVDEAMQMGTELIISHHPVIFEPLKQINPATASGSILYQLIQHNIAAICLHTNLDAAKSGVNSILAHQLGVENTRIIEPLGEDAHGPYGIGLYGNLNQNRPLSSFLPFVKDTLGCDGLRYHDAGKPVFHVAVGGGSCGDFVHLAPVLEFDTLVTADVKHNHFITAKEYGVNLIDAGHFYTENPVIRYLYVVLKEKLSLDVHIAKANIAPVRFY
ncbi:MAG TPA: Nif3-like dinuclear metal center hexameric protein [Clostridiales bacterium]|jgi:dinuclear metal center YbgI/SA1388 family protein|nr:Nif3-like dinuclear metal center hexameric protein [Clostridiales bacterium]